MNEVNGNRLSVACGGLHAYDIVWEKDFHAVSGELAGLGLEGRKACVVTDSNVAALHLDSFLHAASPVFKSVTVFSFPAGEESKNLDTVRALYTRLIEESFERGDCLIALGGGVAGDLTGYAAATYLRGIRFIQVPTSLLAMVDSSIGGKTGVDFEQYKNMVGAFYQPSLVYMNLSVLLTLSERDYRSGMAEIIKHGLIRNAGYYSWLMTRRQEILDRDYEALLVMIRESCAIKRDIVERDPKEAGERALLNFGHTLGHAVEKLKFPSLLHGECVSIGMAAASLISARRGYLSHEEYEKIVRTLQSFGLPVLASGITAQEIVEAAGHDKKMDAGWWKFILLKQIGDAVIDRTVTREEAADAALEILKS